MSKILDVNGRAPVEGDPTKPNPDWVTPPISFQPFPDGYLYKLGPNPIKPDQLVLHTVEGRIVAALSHAVDGELICEAVKLYLSAINQNKESYEKES